MDVAGGALIQIVFSLCCLLGCLLVGVGILVGIVMLLKRSGGTEDAEADVDMAPDDGDDPEEVSPEEETQQVPDDLGNEPPVESEPSSNDSEVDSAPPVEPPPVSPKAAGQTIIAFDDDDEDF